MVLQACKTVEWSRPPKALPISGKLSWVSSRARHMAIWRGLAMTRVRFLESRFNDFDAVEVGDCFLDVFHGNLLILRSQQVFKRFFG